MEQLSHVRGLAATCQPRGSYKWGPQALAGSAVQRPRETDVPCLSSLTYPQHSFSQELTETQQGRSNAEHLPLPPNLIQ